MKSSQNLKVCSVSPQGDTGMAYYDFCFCQALAEAGLDITLFTSRRWLFQHRGKNFRSKEYFFGVHESAEPFVRLANHFLSLWQIFFYVLQKKIRIIHFQTLAFPILDLMFLLWFKLWRRKIVYSPHDMAALKIKAGRELTGNLFDSVDVIVVHSLANKILLIKEFDIEHDRIKIIQQGNYTAFLNPGITKVRSREKIGLPQEKKIVLLFGHLRHDKGITTAIKALRLLKDKNIVLLIAGKPHPEFMLESLRRDINTPELKDWIILKDEWIDDALAELYYKSADVVLLPYESCYTSAVLIYAFSCGASTIVSNIPELTEFVSEGENALIFPAGEAAALAEKIEQLLRNPALAEKIAASAKNTADTEWKWEIAANTQKKIYEELLSGSFIREMEP